MSEIRSQRSFQLEIHQNRTMVRGVVEVGHVGTLGCRRPLVDDDQRVRDTSVHRGRGVHEVDAGIAVGRRDEASRVALGDDVHQIVLLRM